MSLFSELKKRKVFRTAVFYVPTAWLASEILIVIADRLNAPDWVGGVIVVLFLLGFPVALLLSWLFDIKGQDVEDPSQNAKQMSPGTPLGIILLLASGLFLSTGAYLSYQVLSGGLSQVSVAILPLRTKATDPDSQPYGSGVADEVRSSLRRIDGFKVSAHYSSEAVIKLGLDIPDIASKLDVQYIVDGTLDLVGQSLKVTVSLMDSSGHERWSQEFDAAIQDINNLQTEIVRTVAMQLGVNESNTQLQSVIKKPAPTQDVEARRLYLVGKYGRYGMEGSLEDSSAMKAFKAARDRDPGYAAVYPAIALSYATRCWALDDRHNPQCEMAIDYAKRGLQIEPDLPEALATLALVYSIQYRYSESQAAIDRLQAFPDHAIESSSLPWAYMNLGRMQETWDSTEEFYRNDPLNPSATLSMALYAWALKKDNDLVDYYSAIHEELTGRPTLTTFPVARVHRVDMETAIADLRQNLVDSFQVTPDLAEITVTPLYDPSYRKTALADLERLYEDGEIRDTWYWQSLINLHETDRAIELAFDLRNRAVLNPAMFWAPSGGHLEFRGHKRFIELVEHVGLASYWDEVGWPPFCEPRGDSYFCGNTFAVE